VPEVPPADDPRWQRAASLVGIDLDLDRQFRLLRDELAPYLCEFASLIESPPGDWRFDPANGYFQGADAATLFAMIRWRKPQRVIEIGSGSSTVVAARALTMNREEAVPSHLTAIDPEPRLPELASLSGLDEIHRSSAVDIPIESLTKLAEGDFLIVDSSHTVKLGSEVNFLLLEVLPRLQPGVWVHFHDIFLPYDYPYEWFRRGAYLAEQYLLQGFLIGNRDWRVELALQAMSRSDSERFSALVEVEESNPFGRSSFWLHKIGQGRAADQ
jgi:hypothetical protein